MSELFDTTSVIKLESQPFFPGEDLSRSNADILRFTLPREPGLQAYANILKPYQIGIFTMASRAINLCGITLRYDEDELQAFSEGFATFVTIATTVKPPRAIEVYDSKRAQDLLFVDATTRAALEDSVREYSPSGQSPDFSDAMADMRLADSFAQWEQRQPITDSVIVTLGRHAQNSELQLAARRMGANVAYQLAA